jgi:hypothetical protein
MCLLCHVIYHSCDEGSWRQSLLSTTRRCKACGRNLITGLTSAASPRVDISSTCKVGQKLGVSLPLLTCSPSAWPSQLLDRRGWKSRRDLWITLYIVYKCMYTLLEFIHAVYVAWLYSTAVFFNHRATAQYWAMASIIPGRERFSWNSSF